MWVNRETNDITGLVSLSDPDFLNFSKNLKNLNLSNANAFKLVEGPPGHIHGGLLATIGDVVTAYAALSNFVMTHTLEIIFRSPVPINSILRFSGGKKIGQNIRSDAILCAVDFFDVRNNLKFTAKGIFARPKLAKL